MATMARIVGLFAGQGMAHLIEIYNGGVVQPAADFLVMIDFGGNTGPGENAVDYTFNKITAMTVPRIDLMVISHQDSDHLKLLTPLGDKLQAASIAFQIGAIYCGGHGWSAASVATVKSFVSKASNATSVVTSFAEPFRTDYANLNKLKFLKQYGIVKIRVLIAQIKLPKVEDDILRNGTSAVIVVENGESAVVLPGDATFQTLDEINKMYAAWEKKGKSPVPSVTMLEVPHHGALRTAVENYLATGLSSTFDFIIVQSFGNFVRPDGIYASAGKRNTHGHPVKEVLDVFDKHLDSTKTFNEYVAFVFDNKSVERRDRFENFKQKLIKRTTVTRINPDGSYYWTDIVVDLVKGSTVDAMIRNDRSLDEILVEQGLGAPRPDASRPGAAASAHPDR